jgi:MFS family permease
MNQLLVVLTFIVALAAAVRSTWSPCGLSMLSTITPLTERGRGRNYAVTSMWFIIGALLGGLTLGLGAALFAVLFHVVGLSVAVALALCAFFALVAATSDLRILGFHLPGHTRQVNEQWLDSYRSWVYGAGFGWQIGVGLATYIMTAAVYLTIVMAALTASPLVAVAIGAFFGFIRGLAILLTVKVTTPAQLRSFHRRFASWSDSVESATIVVQVMVAAIAAVAIWGPAGAVGSLLIVAVLVVLSRRSTTTSTSTSTSTEAEPAQQPQMETV